MGMDTQELVMLRYNTVEVKDALKGCFPLAVICLEEFFLVLVFDEVKLMGKDN